ncbi:EcsC family protein [Neoroseomonas soli]|uniref:EcsC family protein n=1 Tax=Neoroseomonas soli TaxID=1081025 RepID=A0A9X9WZM4_9PROT|nr:EcsC family protein [Neoroseomonas soli]MBR0672603.1 EcsC family protein [Neoroseomonas soli]
MSLTLTTPDLPQPVLRDLRGAFDALEHPSLAARLAAMAGMPVEALRARLPAAVQGGLDGAVRGALSAAMTAALRSGPARTPLPVPSAWFHRGLVVASGALGGAFGLPGTLVELPVSTAILLRQVAAIGAEAGEDLSAPEAAAECLKVFALGGTSPSDDAAESGYFAVRLALAEALKGAVGRTIVPGFVTAVASRFIGPVGLKLSAQAAPVLGAAAGAAVNLAFLEHFRSVARGHFTLRRLERTHGTQRVRAAWDALAASRDAPFLEKR